uniref:Potassium channel tetramerisation-type BTB domain-containing protein n=1 Tax=viral metagenome TaxID=1070528 RepID=A0A6C0C8N1_9ZZZZ
MSIRINVSGRIFNVSKETICKSQLFNGMLADCTIDDEIVIDRSAKLFEHMYSYLLDNKYPYPKKYYSELDYYLVSYDINLLYDPDSKWKNECEKLNHKISKMEIVINLTIDSSIETKIKNLPKKCSFPMCYSNRRFPYGVCYAHHGLCCHRSNDPDFDARNGKHCCQNKPYRSGIYCEGHISDYLL